MKATEARNKAYIVNTDLLTSQYAEIIKLIELEANKGNYFCFYHKSLIPDVKEKLCADGYKINTYFYLRDGTTITITW